MVQGKIGREGGPKRILVISDDPKQRLQQLLERNLAASDYELMGTGHTGAELNGDLIELIPDLVIVDFALPYLDGIKICLRVRQWSLVPILVLSATSVRGDAVRALDLSSDDYLTEPINFAALVTLIENILSPDLTCST